MSNPSFTQLTARVRNDDGNETTATWRQAQGANDSDLVNTNFRVRFRIDETASVAWSNVVWNLRYQINGAGGYLAVTASTPIQFSLSPNFADGANTTTQLTGGTGTFVTNNAGMKEATGGATNSGTAGQLFELEWCLKIDAAQVASGNTFDLRVYNGNSAIAAYTFTPRITVQMAYTLNATTMGSYVLTGNNVNLLNKHTLDATTMGSYGLTGNSVSLVFGRKVTTAVGSYALTGIAATLLNKHILDATTLGGYGLTGNSTALSKGYRLAPATGSYVLTGNNVAFPRTYILATATGSYIVTGNGVNFVRALRLTAANGSYSLAGNDAVLTRQLKLIAAIGGYNQTGLDANLLLGRKLIAADGTYAISGTDAGLLQGHRLNPTAGSYVLAGNTVSLYQTSGNTLSASAGSYVLTGDNVTLVHGYVLVADVGAYELTGLGTHRVPGRPFGIYLLDYETAVELMADTTTVRLPSYETKISLRGS